jgi:AraC-like DNA-binding protein/DNA-binding HxlR family transcriptional regulator
MHLLENNPANLLDQCVADAIARMADKWIMQVALALNNAGPEAVRFGELSRCVFGISQKMLSLTLARMTKEGWVCRIARSSHSSRIDYRLTDTGRALALALIPLRCWAETFTIGSSTAFEEPDKQRLEDRLSPLTSAAVLRTVTNRHVDASTAVQNVTPTAMPDLHLMRVDSPRELVRGVYKPVLCFVIAGAKQAITPDGTFDVHPGEYFVIYADRPVAGRVLRATPESPFMAVYIDLDMTLMQQIAIETSALQVSREETEVEAAIADCVRRLLIFLDRPEARLLLSNGVMRELFYWLLAGKQGAALRNFVRPEGPARQIAAAIARLRADYMEPLSVALLAEVANMSLSSFYQHFKAITLLSPMQFQKQLRLIESRRLMTVEHALAKVAAHQVGYASLSHFSRDYRRLFGEAPRRHATESSMYYE